MNDPGDWDFGPTVGGKLYSYDEDGRPISMRRTGDGDLAFDIPGSPGQVDYLTAGGFDLRRFDGLRLVYGLEGRGTVKPVGDSYVTARVRLFFQRQGDDWTGRGRFEHYRWWSVAFGELVEAERVVIQAELHHSLWTSVYGQTDRSSFEDAMRECRAVGMTFGGTYAGHGVRVRDGNATFVLRSFETV